MNIATNKCIYLLHGLEIFRKWTRKQKLYNVLQLGIRRADGRVHEPLKLLPMSKVS